MSDARSRVSMGSVDHVEDGKRELVKDVHWLANLGVRVSNSDRWDICAKWFQIIIGSRCQSKERFRSNVS